MTRFQTTSEGTGLIRLCVRAPAEASEEVLGAMLELAPNGVEQVDGEGYVEYAIYGSPGELPELEEGYSELGGFVVTVSASEVPDNWADRWRAFHQPVLIGERVYVRQPWEDALNDEGVIDLVVDPGRAFGTGAHATTRMCLELLLGIGEKGSVCDLGCGSGVLAIAAAKLGFGPVRALDADRLAVDATVANAAANGVALDRVDRIDLRGRPAPGADLVVANLMRPLLLRVAGLMDDVPKRMITSGLLAEEADEVSRAFGPILHETARLQSGDWVALLLERE